MLDIENLRALAADGLSQTEAAERLGVSQPTVCRAANSHSVVFRDGRRKFAGVDQRAAPMAALYRAGYTLQQIGAQYQLTRERVRQILRKYTDVAAQDGGGAERSRRKRDRRAAELDAAYLRRLGISWDEYKQFRQAGRDATKAGIGYRAPLRAFGTQRNSAKWRGIAWEISFAEWWAVWQRSGKWPSRGRGQFVMCRRGDVGPYAAWNVFIDTAANNCSKRKGRKHDLPTGVSLAGGKFVAHRYIDRRSKYLGSFATPELAHAAYLLADPASTRAAA